MIIEKLDGKKVSSSLSLPTTEFQNRWDKKQYFSLKRQDYSFYFLELIENERVYFFSGKFVLPVENTRGYEIVSGYKAAINSSYIVIHSLMGDSPFGIRFILTPEEKVRLTPGSAIAFEIPPYSGLGGTAEYPPVAYIVSLKDLDIGIK